MSTSDVIALAALIISLLGAPFTVGAWKAVRQRWRYVRDLLRAADRYIKATGKSDESAAERGDARNAFRDAAAAARALNDPQLDAAVTDLADRMNRGENVDSLRTAQVAIRRHRWH